VSERSGFLIPQQHHLDGVDSALVELVFDDLSVSFPARLRAQYDGLLVKPIIRTAAFQALLLRLGATRKAAAVSASSVADAEQVERPVSDGSEQSVLLVDDDRRLSRAISRYLERALGRPVITAASVSEAMELVKQSPPRVAVIDLKLPDGTGFDLLLKLRELGPGRLPAIAYTGYDDLGFVDRAEAVGFDSLYLKGRPLRDLAAEVRRLLG